ncbi:MAG: phage tail protein [Gammaproteobacteria bacterium]|nr:phage tail protein [Gammaproteobacteria bacterium]
MLRSQIENLLPAVFRRTLRDGQPLAALLQVMEDLHTPSETLFEQLPALVNPYSAPEHYLPMLAHWVNLDGIFPPHPPGDEISPWLPRRSPIPAGRLRVLIAAAARLARWRGTTHGLREFLGIATGTTDFQIDENTTDSLGNAVPFHLRIVAPKATRHQQELIERIVQLEKPAYVTWELEFEGHARSTH